MKQALFIGALTLFMLGSCSGDHSHEGHEHEGHDHSTEAPHGHEGHHHEAEADEEGHTNDEIILPEAKAKAAGVVTEVIQPAPFRQVIRTGGQILAATGQEVTLVATVNGTVKLNKLLTEGSEVKQGSTLLTLSADHLAEGDPVQKVRIDYETARGEYERMKPLVEQQIVSEKAFAQARQAYETTRIAYEAVSSAQGADGQHISAPMAGYIKKLTVNEGDYVTVGHPLAVLTQTRRLQLRADVSERYYAALSQISSAHFLTPYDGKIYRLSDLNGRLVSYGKAAAGHYLPVTFEFDNRTEAVPGSFVEVYLLGAEMPAVISLPVSALTEEQGSYFVYRRLDAEGYEKQLVSLGASDGARVQILQGVRAGDRIVTQGAYQVKLASATAAIPAHSHEH